MSIEKSDLPGANLPDDTAATQAPAVPNSALPSAADIARGYSPCGAQRIPSFDSQIAGGENEVGDPFTFGGFLGRPQGYQR